MNNEKNSAPKGKQKATKGDEGVFDSKKGVLGKTTNLRGVHEGKNKRCSS